jgi:phage-related protein
MNISFAFDGLTEEKVAELKRWLGDKKIHELIFDETPYKAYQAKITGSATMKHIPFGATGKRVYKGEGSIQFTAY